MTEKEVVIFNISDLHCAINIEFVQEVINPIDVTTVYGVSHKIYGVINLRGNIVSILDTKIILGFESKELSPNAKVIILIENGEQIGLLVDQVEGADMIHCEKFQGVPSNISSKYSKYFSQIFQYQDRLICLINIDTLLDQK